MKKMKTVKIILSMIISVLIILSCCAVVGAVPRPLFRGDINDDGSYTMDDVIMLQKYIAKLTELKKMSVLAADADNDGDIDMEDAVLVQKVIAKLTRIEDQEIWNTRLTYVDLRCAEGYEKPEVGKPMKFKAIAHGSRDYQYEFFIDEKKVQDKSENDTFEYTFNEEKYYRVTVGVYDGFGVYTDRSYGFNPKIGFEETEYITLKIDESCTDLESGKPIKLIAQAFGGPAPYKYEFYVDDKKVQEKSENNVLEYNFDKGRLNYDIIVVAYNDYDNGEFAGDGISYLATEFQLSMADLKIVQLDDHVSIVTPVPDWLTIDNYLYEEEFGEYEVPEHEEKEYCTATLDDEFEDDAVGVVLMHDVSIKAKIYTKDDFNISGIKEVEDLTQSYVDTIRRGYFEEGNTFDIRKFHQILRLTLEEKSKENVLRVVKELEKLDFIMVAQPMYIHHYSLF